MKRAKEIYNELCQELGSDYMAMITNNWKHKLIYDYIQDGTINDYINSL